MYCPWCKKDTQFTEYLEDQFVRNMDGELVGDSGDDAEDRAHS